METDLRAARTAAEAAAQAKSDFLANMSHEIRTPLNGVLGLSSFLEDDSLPDSVREVGSLIRSSGEMLRRVLDDVLDFSKIESGKLELENEPFSLRDSLEWSLAIYRKAALDKHLDLGLEFVDGSRDRIVGDSTRLRQVLTNLISNAVKFTDQGRIRVSAALEEIAGSSSSFRLRVVVSDTGIGIAADRMERLFQSFTQIDASIGRRFGGTGLGLAICKRLIEMMGGNLTATSEPGSGTSFIFSVVVGSAQQEAEIVEQIESNSVPRRILVVEDNPVNCLVIRKMLEKLGHVVELVNDGDRAIEQFQQMDCDLIFMDVNMPGMDGLEVTRRIRSLPGSRANVPILALTAAAFVNDRQACLDAGMNDCLSKPTSMESLRNSIDNWTAREVSIDRNSVPS
jgi:CheY-like chemotaxis protein